MSKSFQLKALREKRGEIKSKLEELGAKLKNETRAMSADEKTAFEKLKTDFVAVQDSIRTAESDIQAIDDLVGAATDTTTPAPADPAANGGMNSKGDVGREDRNTDPRNGKGNRREPEELRRHFEDLRLARQAWARKQHRIPLTREHVAACKRVGMDPRAKELVIRLGAPETRSQRLQQRALSVTTTAGGYLIAEDYSYELETKLVDFSAVRGVVREMQTEGGSDLPWPTEDDTSNTGELLGINSEVAFTDPVFSSITFGAYKFSSKGVLVPNELIQDAAFDVDGMVMSEVGTRIGRAQGSYFTTGTGTSQPKGIVTCASAGNTTASGTAFTGKELTLLEHSVDPAYRKNPGVGYMMKDDVVAYVMTLLDSQNRPLFRSSFRDGSGVEQLTINGYPVYTNQFMAGLTTNAPASAAKHVLFGDFKKFIVRDAGAIRLRKLEERYAEKDQTGFIAFMRSDSNCVNTSAIKYMLQA